MEQLLIFIAFYILYLLFSALVNRQRKQSGAGKAPRKSVPLKPPQPPADASPSMGQPLTEAEEPQLELPPFLKQMLGLEEPQKSPPVAETIPEEAARTEEPPEGSPPGLLRGDVVGTEAPVPFHQEPEVWVSPASRQKAPAHPLHELLRSKSMLAQAFMLKEILDAPVSKRPGRFFKIMR